MIKQTEPDGISLSSSAGTSRHSMLLRRSRIWFCAFSRRLLRKKSFLLLLCIFPVISVCVTVYSHTSRPLLQVALYNEGSTTLAERSITILLEQNSAVHFYQASSAEQVYQDVESRKAECGYVFTADYTYENLLDSSKWYQSVRVIESPASMLAGSINELVFDCFFRFYNEEMLTDYLSQPKTLEQKEMIQEINELAAELYEQYIQADTIFTSDQSETSLPEEAPVQQKNLSLTQTYLGNLCRGLLSVLILLAALCGASSLSQDHKSSLFLPLPAKQRCLIELLEILSPVVLTAFSGLIGLAFLPGSRPLLKELAGLILYIPAVTLYARILLYMLRSGNLFRMFIPLITLGALLFAPVLIDLSTYFKLLSIPKYLFINSYYLELMLHI